MQPDHDDSAGQHVDGWMPASADPLDGGPDAAGPRWADLVISDADQERDSGAGGAVDAGAGDTVDAGAGGARYRGRRRATFTVRQWLAVAATLVLFSSAAVASLVLTSAHQPGDNAILGLTGSRTDVGPSPSNRSASPGASSSAASLPAASRTGRSASSSPSLSRAPATAPRTAPPALAPTAYEAEAAAHSIGGSAWVSSYSGASGGRIVRNVGDWGSSSGDGWLRFNNVTVPAAGTYQLTLYVVHLDGESARTVVVTVSGGRSTAFVVTGSATCCATARVSVVLGTGANAITIANPNGHAPSIDKIVIQSG